MGHGARDWHLPNRGQNVQSPPATRVHCPRGYTGAIFVLQLTFVTPSLSGVFPPVKSNGNLGDSLSPSPTTPRIFGMLAFHLALGTLGSHPGTAAPLPFYPSASFEACVTLPLLLRFVLCSIGTDTLTNMQCRGGEWECVIQCVEGVSMNPPPGQQPLFPPPGEGGQRDSCDLAHVNNDGCTCSQPSRWYPDLCNYANCPCPKGTIANQTWPDQNYTSVGCSNGYWQNAMTQCTPGKSSPSPRAIFLGCWRAGVVPEGGEVNRHGVGGIGQLKFDRGTECDRK